MDLNGSVWYSKLESEVLLAEFYGKLNDLPEKERTKVVISWLINSFGDVTSTRSITSTISESRNHFIVNVKLLNMLVNNSSFEVADDLSNLFQSEFLDGFVKPALLDHVDASHCFQLLCENISQPLLIRRVVKFAMNFLLPTLFARLKTDDPDIVAATLGIFKGLLEFFCEDLWHELILQHLLPMKHLLVSERQKAVPEINYQDSTLKFLNLIPVSICNSIKPESMSESFCLYVQQELQRIRDVSTIISTAVPLSKSEVTRTNHSAMPSNDHTTEYAQSRNAIFPMWIFKYDGTDLMFASRKYKLSEPEEYFEDDLFQFVSHEGIQNEQFPDPDLNNQLLLLEEKEEPMTGMHIRALVPEATTKTAIEDQGYFGPFLETLFQLLGNWTRLEPHVTATLSDIFSVLASSRIPLISSLLLDASIVLQPSYPNFHGMIHSIQTKLDGSMRKYSNEFVLQAWKEAETGNLITNSLDDEDLFDESQKNFTDTLKLRFMKSTALASFFSQITSKKSTKMFGNAIEKNMGIENAEQEIIAQKTALRCIMFTHWMLELAAISQQTSWSQARQNQREINDDD